MNLIEWRLSNLYSDLGYLEGKRLRWSEKTKWDYQFAEHIVESKEANAEIFETCRNSMRSVLARNMCRNDPELSFLNTWKQIIRFG